MFIEVAPAPTVIGKDESPVLAQVIHRPGRSGRSLRVGIAVDPEHVTIALGAGHHRRHALRDVNRLQFFGDRHRCQVDAGVHRTDDEIGLGTLHQGAELARPRGRVSFRVLDHVLDRPPGDAVVVVKIINRRLCRLVVPIAP